MRVNTANPSLLSIMLMLLASIVIDFIGMITYLLPGFGERK